MIGMKVLITGGAGFIGATVATACLEAGITPVILDDLSTGRREFTEGRIAYEGDIADAALLDGIFADHPDIAATIHCAAKIVVPDSVADPVAYYDNNVAKTCALVEQLLRLGCTRLLFSSSASIYAPGADLTVDEQSALAPGSPYARTKMVVELFLADVAAATGMRVLSLRYFNPIGADPLLRTGLQLASPSHAVGKLLEAYAAGTPFQVTGVEYATRDGSAIRDYIHVWDLALAHVAALREMDRIVEPGTALPINVGTGDGTTVRELVAAFRAIVGEFESVDAPPRPGDVIGSYTRSERAAELLGWKAERSLEDGLRDSLAWLDKRPDVLGF
jgi:UDP-glucose 4-epimerase